METSPNAPSSDAAPLTSSSLSTAPDARRVAGASSAIVEETSLNTPLSDAAPPMTNPPPTVPDVGQVARAAPEEVALPVTTSKASHKSKGKVSDREFALFDFSTIVCKGPV